MSAQSNDYTAVWKADKHENHEKKLTAAGAGLQWCNTISALICVFCCISVSGSMYVTNTLRGTSLSLDDSKDVQAWCWVMRPDSLSLCLAQPSTSSIVKLYGPVSGNRDITLLEYQRACQTAGKHTLLCKTLLYAVSGSSLHWGVWSEPRAYKTNLKPKVD